LSTPISSANENQKYDEAWDQLILRGEGVSLERYSMKKKGNDLITTTSGPVTLLSLIIICHVNRKRKKRIKRQRRSRMLR
jgi:hypothetical protein